MSCPWRRGRLLPLFALISSVWADYYIDDTNTTLTYSSGPKAAWAPYAVGAETLELLLPNGTYQVIDAFVCYNHTYRYAACFDADTCLLTVPFTGSGITVYVNQAGPVGINASITVDGANAQTNVLNAPPAPAYQIANVSMFDVQQLPSGSHTLKLLINDLFGSYTGMMFDYAYVNETLVANTTLTTTTTSSASIRISASTSSPARSTSAPHTDTSAIIGGVIGVLAVVVLGVLVFVWMRRRRGHGHVPEMIDVHSHGTSPPPFDPRARYDPVTTGAAGTSRYDPYVGSTAHALDIPLVPNRLVASGLQPSPSSPSSGRDTQQRFWNTQQDRSRRLQRHGATNAGLHVPSTDTRRSDGSPLLTDEQADFINSLHQNNVPAAAIARVLERMLADRHAGIREWERETRLARTSSMSTAPPSYDLVAERG
ncbi:hypothetical protein L210DRAFT_3763893 [Boletus edulis BED1]|uniref:Transmembrane protein n=1 Tax=Boletus edulis BED1 TaxID=1328754 RepID=A0AAD4BJ35_BOLED|nr:hypothetical protein L210DRAFT_3763893 [Boletus edulis BED1]